MGYTHYYRLNPKGNEAQYQQAKALIVKIIENSPVPLGDGGGDNPITKENYSKEIWINGLGKNSHETFYLPEKLSELRHPSYAEDKTEFVFNFTKTARKPYDVVVTACLTVLKFYLRKDAEISGDGGEEGFEDGMKLAERILGMPFPNPTLEIENSVDFIRTEK